jgi:hypothetical protein
MKESILVFATLILFTAACNKNKVKPVEATFDNSAFTENTCSQASGLESDSAATTITITFTNNTDRDLHINWIDYAGAEQDWIDLDMGTSDDVPTFLTHVWIVRQDDGSCVTILTPKAGASSTETVTFTTD